MQVFIIGSPLETAKILDKKRLNKQILEIRQILKAINGESKAWVNHPCTLQYKEYKEWLISYLNVLINYQKHSFNLKNRDYLGAARVWNNYSMDFKPSFHDTDFFDNMKRRLYSKDNKHYKQFAYLGESEENHYFVNGELRVYINGKRVD